MYENVPSPYEWIFEQFPSFAITNNGAMNNPVGTFSAHTYKYIWRINLWRWNSWIETTHIFFKKILILLIYTSCSSVYLQFLIMTENARLCISLKSLIYNPFLLTVLTPSSTIQLGCFVFNTFLKKLFYLLRLLVPYPLHELKIFPLVFHLSLILPIIFLHIQNVFLMLSDLYIFSSTVSGFGVILRKASWLQD